MEARSFSSQHLNARFHRLGKMRLPKARKSQFASIIDCLQLTALLPAEFALDESTPREPNQWLADLCARALAALCVHLHLRCRVISIRSTSL
jgi:hypothetical protein